ncbi:MBL fold metallo-hydrolase [Eremococcus coleocola]|uniref:Metallo-beta-lactamase domain protein n=1 Tax=Eremococcus coleocola ACS-139-V-Col8 TaxID=908337 RepID=E4KQV6_9LACT|nr:MBL fold metallo-hydrolase [Eremococcus coleocola]EFR30571.1 metallo-beta-lactamase domain protein [Eremococcus coleocola ACS-139-V-Col8]
MKLNGFVVGLAQENTYVLSDEIGQALIFDPGDQADQLINQIEAAGLKPIAICLTHCHFDHIGAVDALRDHFEIPVYAPELEADWLSDPNLNLSAGMGLPPVIQAPADYLWQEMGPQTIGSFNFELAHVPGHSPGHLIYHFAQEDLVVCGDTVFYESVGRTDFPGCSFDQLKAGIEAHIFTLPDETQLYPGHGPATSVGHEKLHNPFLT